MVAGSLLGVAGRSAATPGRAAVAAVPRRAARAALNSLLLCASLTELSKWHAAVADVRLFHILPSGYGGRHGDAVDRAAWQGDKLLGTAIAKLQIDAANAENRAPRVGELTSVHSIATSNELLAQQLPKILPVQYAAAPRNAIRLQQAHDGGTMVEAAVLKVLERDDGEAAVAELAAWLMSLAYDDSPVVHAKGRLLTIGGNVTSSRFRNERDEAAAAEDAAPRWRAVARLPADAGPNRAIRRDERRDLIASYTATSAAEAERWAAHSVLQQLSEGVRRRRAPVEEALEEARLATDANDAAAPSAAAIAAASAAASAAAAAAANTAAAPANGAAPFRGVPTWRQTRRAPDTLVANLRDGEDMVGWWHRGAYGRSAFHRTVMAPYVFDTVVNVDTWRRIEQNGIYAVLVAIVARGADGSLRYHSAVGAGRSSNGAHMKAAMSANRLVESLTAAESAR